MAEIEFLRSDIGTAAAHRRVVLRGQCPFCQDKVTFRQLESDLAISTSIGRFVALLCEGCHSPCSYSMDRDKFYPSLALKGISGLPNEIEKYYNEAVRCLEADAPNGAVTLFRKVIHALGIHYKLAKRNDDKGLYEIIKSLHIEGHIVQKLRDALIGVKDIGNDGAHINDNEPDIAQARHIWGLIDTVLNATVIADASLEILKKKHHS